MKKSSKIRTKSHSRPSSKHQLDNNGSLRNVTSAPTNRRNSRRLSSSISNLGSKVVTAEVEDEEEDETKMEEQKDEEKNDEQLGEEEWSDFNNEKEAIVKLCQKITENFWNTAWSICSERFYSGNAPCMIALELRNTWLRIIEAQWMDQDENDLPSHMFVPDEPPMPLLFESPSTDLFLQSRLKDESVEEISAGGEPHGNTNLQMDKNSRKIDNENGTRSKKGDKGDSTKKKNLGKKGPPPPSKIPTIKKTKTVVKDNKSTRVVPFMKKKPLNHHSKVKQKDRDNDKISDEIVQVAKGTAAPVSAVNEQTENSTEAAVLPTNDLLPTNMDENTNNPSDFVSPPSTRHENPSLEVEVPWNVIFTSKYKFDDDNDDLSPSMSQEYRFLGIVPWSPAQGQQGQLEKNSGVFRFVHETSTVAKQRTEHEHQQQQQKQQQQQEQRMPVSSMQIYYPQPPPTPPTSLATQKLKKTTDKILSKEEEEAADQSDVKIVTTGLSIKKGSILLNTIITDPGTSGADPSSRIVERIDNLLDADSDHVVDILLPTEVGPVNSAGSQEFSVNGIEFEEHFSKPDNRANSKSEGKTSMGKKSKFRNRSISAKIDKGKKVAQTSHTSKSTGSDSEGKVAKSLTHSITQAKKACPGGGQEKIRQD